MIKKTVLIILVFLFAIMGLYAADDGDVITEINGEKVSTTSEFKYELYKHSVGDTIEVTYIRDGKEKKTNVTLNKNSE